MKKLSEQPNRVAYRIRCRFPLTIRFNSPAKCIHEQSANPAAKHTALNMISVIW